VEQDETDVDERVAPLDDEEDWDDDEDEEVPRSGRRQLMPIERLR
jgi:hypothetical protein